MKKKYIISFIIIVALLIASVIALGIISNVKMDELEDTKYYKIGEVEIKSINYATSTSLNIENYSYGKNSYEQKKHFEYSSNNASGVVGLYTEYLIADENFVITKEEDNFRELKKEYETKDSLLVEISFKNDEIVLYLTYTYAK